MDGGYAVTERVDGSIYLVISLRDFGAGIGVCQGSAVRVGLQRRDVDQVPKDELRAQSRDLYIPAGDVGLLYSDQVGAQRTISRFTLVPIRRDDADEALRLISTARHLYLDRAGPR